MFHPDLGTDPRLLSLRPWLASSHGRRGRGQKEGEKMKKKSGSEDQEKVGGGERGGEGRQ